jgi:hypothetical protein
VNNMIKVLVIALTSSQRCQLRASQTGRPATAPAPRPSPDPRRRVPAAPTARDGQDDRGHTERATAGGSTGVPKIYRWHHRPLPLRRRHLQGFPEAAGHCPPPPPQPWHACRNVAAERLAATLTVPGQVQGRP